MGFMAKFGAKFRHRRLANGQTNGSGRGPRQKPDDRPRPGPGTAQKCGEVTCLVHRRISGSVPPTAGIVGCGEVEFGGGTALEPRHSSGWTHVIYARLWSFFVLSERGNSKVTQTTPPDTSPSSCLPRKIQKSKKSASGWLISAQCFR